MYSNTVIDELREKLENVKEFLPKGYATTVSEDLNLSKSAVYGVISGKINNREVLMALISLATNEQARIRKVLEQ